MTDLYCFVILFIWSLLLILLLGKVFYDVL